MQSRPLTFVTPQCEADYTLLRELLREYAATIPVDLNGQAFEDELRDLPGPFAEPRGTLVLAWSGNTLVGCCLLRPLDNSDYPNTCEMKHLFIRPAFRALGLGRRLAEHILEMAQVRAYDSLLLDTHVDMEAARALYEDLGFVEIPPYHCSPFAGAHYLRARLA